MRKMRAATGLMSHCFPSFPLPHKISPLYVSLSTFLSFPFIFLLPFQTYLLANPPPHHPTNRSFCVGIHISRVHKPKQWLINRVTGYSQLQTAKAKQLPNAVQSPSHEMQSGILNRPNKQTLNIFLVVNVGWANVGRTISSRDIFQSSFLRREDKTQNVVRPQLPIPWSQTLLLLYKKINK